MVKDGQVVVATTSNSTASRDLKGKGRALGPSQTLYTPVFYTPSPPVAGMSGIQGRSPSTSSSKPGANTKRKTRGRSKTGPRKELERVKDQVHLPNLSSTNLKRLEELSKRHIALSSNAIPEIPDSQPSSPSPSSSHSELHQNDPVDTQTKKPEPKYALDTNNPDSLLAQDLLNGLELKVALNPHIRTLRTKLSEALQNTSYDPSHGNWASLSSILHLGVTAGGPRWVGARADGSPVDIRMELEKRGGVGSVSVGERGRRKRGALDWCNAETEEEWFEWEKMFEKEMALKKRVEEWTKGVVVVEDGARVGVPGLGLQSSQLQPSFSREEEEEAGEGEDGVVETSELIEQVLEGGEATTVHEESIPVNMALAKEERAKQAAKFQAKSVKEKKPVDPLRGVNNPLGFSMTKRTAANAATVRANHKGLPPPPPHPNAHPQTSPSKSSPSKGSPSKYRLLGQTLKEKEAKEREEKEKKERKEKEERKKKNRKELISDLSDITSFPTPSFPESQLVTSTPPPLGARRGGLPPPPPFPLVPPPPAQAQPDAGAARSTTPAFAGGFPGFISGFNNDPLAFTSGFGGNTPRTPRTPGKSATTSRPTSPHKPLSSLAKPLFPVSPRSPGKAGQAASATGLQGPVGLKSNSKNAGGEGQKEEDVRAKPGDMQQEPPRTPPPVRRTYGKSPLRASGSLSFLGSPIAGTKRKLSADELEGEGSKTKKARLETEPEADIGDVVMANTTPPRKASASSRAFSVYGNVSGDTYAGGQGQDRFQDSESVPVFSSANATSDNQASNNNDLSSSSLIPGLKEGLPTLTELLASAKKGNKTRGGGGGKLKRRKSARMGMLDVSPVKEPRTSVGGEKQSGMLNAEKESGVVVEEEEEDSFFAGLQDAKQEKEKEKDTDGQQPPPTQEEKQTGPMSTQSMLYGPGASRSLRSPETAATSGGMPTTPRTPTKSHSHSQMRSFLTPRTPKTPTRTPDKAAHASMSMSQVSPSRVPSTPKTPRGAVGGSMSQPVPKTPGTGTNNKGQKTPGSGKTPRGSHSMSLSSSLPPGLGMGGAGPNSPLGLRGSSGFPGLHMNTNRHKESVAAVGAPDGEEKEEAQANADNALLAEDRPNAPLDPFDISLPPTSIEPNPDLYTNDDEDHHPGDFDHNHDEVDPEDIYVPGLDDDYGGLGLAYGYSNNNGGGAYGVGGVYDDDGEGGITDLESPTKSLSSLAGSDSDSDSDFDDDGEFPQGPEGGEAAEGPGGGEGVEEFVFEPDVVSTQKEEQMRLVMPSSSSGNNNPFLDSSLRLGRTEPLALLQQYQSQSQISQSQERSLGRGRSPNKPLMSLQSSQPQSSSQSPDKSQSQRLMRRKSSTISPAKSSQAMYGKYNSQFDVKRRVEEVDKLLERDLELDSSYAGSVVGASVVGGDEDEDKEGKGDEKLFEGWLKDTSD